MDYHWEENVQLKNQGIIDFYEQNCGKCLFILGKGFDPRMCVGIEFLLRAKLDISVCLLEYSEGEHSSSHLYSEYADANYRKLTGLAVKIESVQIDVSLTNLPLFNKRVFTKDFFAEYNRVIIDVSALPQTISFNIIKDVYNQCGDLLSVDVLVCENSMFDDAIVPTGLAETANFLNGFNMFKMGMESENELVSVWMPILGKNCRDELERIFRFLSPEEICPVLPFPSADPKRSDEILKIVGELIFSFSIEKRDLLYIAEDNMLHVYKKLCTAVEYYNKSLEIIGETKFIFSISSSKLIAVGVLLASMEIDKNGISTSFALVENEGYILDMAKYNPENNSIHCICLGNTVFDW